MWSAFDQIDMGDPVPLQEVTLVDLLYSSNDGEQLREGRRSQLQGRSPFLGELAGYDYFHYQVSGMPEPRKINIIRVFKL